MDGNHRKAFHVVSDRKMADIKAFEWSPAMDLLAVLFESNSLNLFRALSDDDKAAKLFSEKIIDGVTLCWSPCGKFVCVGGENAKKTSDISIFDVEGGKVQRETTHNGLVALDWVPASTCADFCAGADLMVPLLAIPSAPSVTETCAPVVMKDSREWSLLVVADDHSVSVCAQGTFPLAKIQIAPGGVVSAKLSCDVRSLSVARREDIVIYSARHLSVRRQELRDVSTLMQRVEFTVDYIQDALREVERCWSNVVNPWQERVKDLTNTLDALIGSNGIHQEILIASSSGKPRDAIREFLKPAGEAMLVRLEKSIMQVFEYAKMVITTRVFIAAQHLLLYFRDLKARVQCPAYTGIGLTAEHVEKLLSYAEDFLSNLDSFLDKVKTEWKFAQTLLTFLVQLSSKLNNSSNSNTLSKEISKRELDAFMIHMSEKRSLSFETIAAGLSVDHETSLLHTAEKLTGALNVLGRHIVTANSAYFSVLSTLPLPASRTDTSHTWFHNELIVTWIENESAGSQAMIVRVKVIPTAQGGEIILQKAVLYGPGWNILLARMYTQNEITLVFSSQGISFLCRLNLKSLQFKTVPNCCAKVPRSQINEMDLELRQLPDGYQHATDLRASPSRGVLSIFAQKMRRFLTLDLNEESDEE